MVGPVHGYATARGPWSNGVAGAGEVEVSRLDRWHDHRRSRTAALARADTLGTSKHLEIVEDEDRRLVPAHVLDRTRDLAILDQEGPVAGEAREQDRALIDAADVPEAGTQDAALGARDHLLERGRAAEHPEPDTAPASSSTTAAATGGLDALLLRPIAIVLEVLHDAVLDPDTT